MKNKTNEFKEYLSKLSEEEMKLLQDFFANIKQRCLLSKTDNYKIKNDFVQALQPIHE